MSSPSRRGWRAARFVPVVAVLTTGDLAHKMVFPALYQMVKRGTLSVPVIGVASAHWDVSQLRERARDSVARAEPGVDDAAALNRLLSLVAYVDGDYGAPAPSTRSGRSSVVRVVQRTTSPSHPRCLLYFRFANSFLEPIWNRNYEHHGRC